MRRKDRQGIQKGGGEGRKGSYRIEYGGISKGSGRPVEDSQKERSEGEEVVFAPNSDTLRGCPVNMKQSTYALWQVDYSRTNCKSIHQRRHQSVTSLPV